MAKKKKDDEEKISQASVLSVVEKSIEKKYGKGVLTLLGDHEDLKIDTISTGCLGLDAATGVGGLARGRIYEVFGPNSSGKSTLALSVVLQGLLRGMTTVYVDAEHALDPKLVRNMGKMVDVDVDKIKMVQAFTGDDSLQITEDLMKTGEVDIFVIDSVSALLPRGMADGEIGDNYIGLLARLMSKACSKLTPVVNETNTLLIFINQTRVDIHKWGDKNVPTGGGSVPYYATGRIKVDGGETKDSRIVDDNGLVIGHESKFLIIKNKLSAPWRDAKINLMYGKGYDYVSEVVDLSIDFGLIDQSGAWYEFNAKRIQGKKNVVNEFKNDRDIYLDFRSKCMNILGLGLKNE